MHRLVSSFVIVCSVGLLAVCGLPVPNTEPVKESEPTIVGDNEQQPKFQYPWPYPPQFEPFLPTETKQQLWAIYMDLGLTPEERSNRVNNVFDALPSETLARIPLPNGYVRLPADVYARIVYVHTMPGFRWVERQELIRKIVESLPIEQQQLIHTHLDGPPPGFEFALAPTIYKQLLFIHYNKKMSKEEKADAITKIMRQVPLEQIERLPMPAGMQNVPMEIQQRLRALVYDYSIPQRIRAARVQQFVSQLPAAIRPPLGTR